MPIRMYSTGYLVDIYSTKKPSVFMFGVNSCWEYENSIEFGSKNIACKEERIERIATFYCNIFYAENHAYLIIYVITLPFVDFIS